MSAIGFYCSVEKVKGKEGEDRVVITMNGKYLPHTEQVRANPPVQHSSKQCLIIVYKIPSCLTKWL